MRAHFRMHAYVYVHIFACMRMWMCTFSHACVCVFSHACVCVSHACICVCTFSSSHACVCVKKLVVTSIPIHFLCTGWTSTAAVRMFLCHIWISSQPGCMTGNRLCGMSSTWAFSEICTLLRCSNYVPRLWRDKVMGRRSDPVQTAVGGAAICDIAAPGPGGVAICV